MNLMEGFHVCWAICKLQVKEFKRIYALKSAALPE